MAFTASEKLQIRQFYFLACSVIISEMKNDATSRIDAQPISVHQTLVTEGIWVDASDGSRDCLLLVRRGAALAASANEEVAIPERHVILAARGAALRMTARRGPLIVVHVEFERTSPKLSPDFDVFMSDLSARWPLTRPLAPPDAGQAAGVFATIRSMASEQSKGDVVSALVLRAHFLSLITSLSRLLDASRSVEVLDRSQQRFRMSLDHIERNIQGRIAVADLARIAGVSYRRYTDVFRERMGASVATYIRSLRVQLAKERLLETGDIVQASLDAGFADLSNFYRVFRAESGTTPKQFIGRNGGNSPIITL